MVFSTLRLASNSVLRGILFPFKKQSFSVIFLSLRTSAYKWQTVFPIEYRPHVNATTTLPQPKKIKRHSWRFPSASSIIPQPWINIDPTNTFCWCRYWLSIICLYVSMQCWLYLDWGDCPWRSCLRPIFESSRIFTSTPLIPLNYLLGITLLPLLFIVVVHISFLLIYPAYRSAIPCFTADITIQGNHCHFGAWLHVYGASQFYKAYHTD